MVKEEDSVVQNIPNQAHTNGIYYVSKACMATLTANGESVRHLVVHNKDGIKSSTTPLHIPITLKGILSSFVDNQPVIKKLMIDLGKCTDDQSGSSSTTLPEHVDNSILSQAVNSCAEKIAEIAGAIEGPCDHC